ncbi:MAG: gliding motility-associated C-terminal domain-containing protein [Flavobacteriales bacterium]|nr:gliding motility-associated C-terminal domain-containing protein [Flavobacteriales bacterium]
MKKVILIISILLYSYSTYGQLTVDRTPPYDNVSFLINDVLLSDDLPISNLNYNGDSIQIGYFKGTNSNLGLNGGIVMGTGDIAILDTSFNGIGEFVNVNPIVTDPDLLDVANAVPDLIGQDFNVSAINDVAVLEFDFVPNSDTVSFNYVFGSQEYLFYENSPYNDVFGFFISGPGISGQYASPTAFTDGSINIATFESVEENSLGQMLPITISSICNFETNNAVYNSHLFVNNQSLESVGGIRGFTDVMTAKVVVQCGETYHIRLAIADGSDAGMSSFIFIEENSFSSSSLYLSNSLGIQGNQIQIPCGSKIELSAQLESEDDYSFIWNTNDTTQSISVGAGSYYVQASNEGCVINSDTIIITETPILVDLGEDVYTCKNENININVKSIDQATPPYSYQWSTGQTTESINVLDGTYWVKIIDANGCEEIDTIIVHGYNLPQARTHGGGNICEGQTSDFPIIDINFSGQSPFYFTFGNGITSIHDTSTTMNYSFEARNKGNYKVTQLKDVNCEGLPSNSVEVTYSTSSSYIENGSVICEGDSALLTIHSKVDAPPYSLYLFNGSYNRVFDDLTESKFEVYVKDSANYTISKLIDKYDCKSLTNEGLASVRFKEPIFPKFITSVDSILCPVDPPILLEAMPTGGVFSGKGVDFEGYFHPINAFEGKSWVYYSFPNNCNETDSTYILIDCEVHLYIPNTFTPNNDQINDFFELRGDNILEFEISVYSRWGQKVFYSNRIEHQWDGTYKNKTLPTGVYTYAVTIYGKDAEIFKQNGYVNLVR